MCDASGSASTLFTPCSRMASRQGPYSECAATRNGSSRRPPSVRKAGPMTVSALRSMTNQGLRVVLAAHQQRGTAHHHLGHARLLGTRVEAGAQRVAAEEAWQEQDAHDSGLSAPARRA